MAPMFAFKKHRGTLTAGARPADPGGFAGHPANCPVRQNQAAIMRHAPDKIAFDDYVLDYEKIINRHAALAGGSLASFIGMRLSIVAELTKRELPSDAHLRIADFGCGIGATEEQIIRMFPNAKVTGFDISAGSIAAARQRALHNVDFQTTVPGVPMPCADHSIDLLYSNGTFHHIFANEHCHVLRDIHRIMRPGGHVFIFENNPLNPVMRFTMKQNPFDADAQMIFPPTMRNRMQAAGLTVVAQGYYCFYLKPFTFMRWSERYLRWLPFGAQYYTWATKPCLQPSM